MSQIYYSYLKSPIGKLMVVGTRSAIKAIMFPAGKNTHAPAPDWIEEPKYLKKAIDQLKAYFAGKLQCFELELSPEGTAFQQSVWKALKEIPYGKTTSYGEIAEKLGNPKASRAVGAANGKNPIPIVIPCHRVIGKSGDLTGFGGGLDTKEKLLTLEQEAVSPQTRLPL